MYSIVLRDYDGTDIVSTYLTNEEAQNQLDKLVEIHNKYLECADDHICDFIYDKFNVYFSNIPELTIEISESLDFKIDNKEFELFKSEKILKDIEMEKQREEYRQKYHWISAFWHHLEERGFLKECFDWYDEELDKASCERNVGSIVYFRDWFTKNEDRLIINKKFLNGGKNV
ncbi:MAG: hypothetical protein RR598_10935 [Anaerorhabdus sp.]